jgi:hypothetical protein
MLDSAANTAISPFFAKISTTPCYISGVRCSAKQVVVPGPFPSGSRQKRVLFDCVSYRRFLLLRSLIRLSRSGTELFRIFQSFVLFSLLFAAVVALGKGRSDIIDIDEIHPGMRGYGLTVFRGTEPERFEVEVIDVLHNFRPSQDLILIRCEHPVLNRATTVAGMSGSPIYLEGRLAGAYAYGWLFGKEPVAGVTPAANMLAELNRPIDPNIWRVLGNLPKIKSSQSHQKQSTGNDRLAGLPPYWGIERLGALGTLRRHAERVGVLSKSAQNDANGLVPVATPLLISGVADPVVDTLNQELDRFGLVALQAGSGQQKPSKASPSETTRFVNGGAIGVQLIRGDISVTAIGTVTHVAENRLVAFGHPMMDLGQVAWPTTTARVLHVLASEQRSFKIAEAVTPLGTLIHDRQSAIVVDTKANADTIPVAVHVRGIKEAPRTQWNMEVVSHRLVTPVLTFTAIANAVMATSSDRSHAVFKAKSRVEIEGHGAFTVEDIGYTPVGISDSMALSNLRLFDLIDVAYGNPFEEARITGIDVDIEVSFVRDIVTIVDASVPFGEVDPGSTIDISVTLREFGKPERVRTLPITIPYSAAGQEIELAVQPGDEVAIEQPKPENLSNLINAVLAGYPSTSLVVSAKLPSQGLKMFGHVVRQLPGSAYDTLQLVNQSEHGDSFATYRRQVVPLGKVITGSARLKLKVRDMARNQK